MNYNLVEIHKKSSLNRKEIETSKLCGCYYCLDIFFSREILEWCDKGETALCPKCGIDSVIGDTDVIITEQLLKKMKKHWFVIDYFTCFSIINNKDE